MSYERDLLPIEAQLLARGYIRLSFQPYNQ
jgi:hypothetical protein